MKLLRNHFVTSCRNWKIHHVVGKVIRIVPNLQYMFLTVTITARFEIVDATIPKRWLFSLNVIPLSKPSGERIFLDLVPSISFFSHPKESQFWFRLFGLRGFWGILCHYEPSVPELHRGFGKTEGRRITHNFDIKVKFSLLSARTNRKASITMRNIWKPFKLYVVYVDTFVAFYTEGF